MSGNIGLRWRFGPQYPNPHKPIVIINIPRSKLPCSGTSGENYSGINNRQGRVASGRALSQVGFIVTNMSRPTESVVATSGVRPRWIKEGKGAIKWTRLSCRTPPPGTPFPGRMARDPPTGRDFRNVQKIATVHPKFSVHPGNLEL
jgi:hypothetical protein